MKKHPEQLHRSQHLLANLAFQEAFPCKP
jgi:hypothetical protein